MSRFLICIVLCTGLLCFGVPAVRAQEPGAPEERTYSYGEQDRQRLTVHWRGGQGRGDGRLGIVVLHGGYWYQDHAPSWRNWAQRFAGSGSVVFDVDYRRNIDARWSAQRDDVLLALRWIRQRARIFGADPGRLVLLGSSAGGHVATSAGTYGAARERVAGVIGLSPVTDPYRAWRDGDGRTGAGPRRRKLRENAARLAGCAPDSGPRCRAVWRDMSAVRHASGAEDAPLLLIHSRADFVPVAHSRALARAQRTAGMPKREVTVTAVPGSAHGGALLRMSGMTRKVLDWANRLG